MCVTGDRAESRACWMSRFGVRLLPPLLFAMLTACAQWDRNANADAQASPAGLQRELIVTDKFVLTAFSRISQPNAPLHLYIEGDGQAWYSTTEPSLDPTPVDPVALKLAVQDPGANVVYLSRPCQFTPPQLNPECGVPWWTGKRFSPAVVQSMNEAVNQLVARTPGQRIDLVGFSGGGAIAILVAARRRDIASIRTVAGNLDDEFINHLHGVASMPESVDAIDYANQVATIAQVHFSGEADAVVPPEVARRFVAAEKSNCARAVTVSGLGHNGDWSSRWHTLLADTPSCGMVTKQQD
jgi:Serine hydrolase (FSH1)